jgi:ATP-dependent helicase/nuclease subunit A
VPTALPVSRLSYSGLESYKRCGYRFYLEKVLRLPALERGPDGLAAQLDLEPGLEREQGPLADAGETPGLPALARGSVVHRLLEELDFAAPATPIAERIGELVSEYGHEATDPDVSDLRAMVERFAASDLRARLARARRVRTELPFAFLLESPAAAGRGLLVNGIVDVHAEEDDRVLIVDYKSDRLDGADPAELVRRSYETQRVVYALAALRSGAPRVQVDYAFLERPEQPVSALFESAQAEELEERLAELAAGVVAARFHPTERPLRDLCHDCPGRPALCSWGPDRTLAPAPG